MKYSIDVFSFLSILVCFSCNNNRCTKQNENVTLKYYDSGFIKSQQAINNKGNRDGFSVDFRDDGSVHSSGFFEDGIHNGYTLIYHENNVPKELNLAEGMSVNGLHIEYYKTGIPKIIGYLDKNNLKQMGWIFYYKNGQVEEINNFKNDKLQGGQIIYHKT